MGRFVPWIAAFLVAAVVSGGLSFLAAAAGQPSGTAQWLPGALIGMLVAVVLVGLRANRKVAMASPAERDAAVGQAPPPGKALLYVYRKSLTAQALGADVTLDGRVMGQIRSGRFLRLAIEPGRHQLSATFASGLAINAKSEPVEFVAVAGGVHVYRIDNRMGLASSTVIPVPVTDPDPRAALKTLSLVQPDAA